MKIGSLVKLSAAGRNYYLSRNKLFECYSVCSTVRHQDYLKSIRRFISVHGIGKIIKINPNTVKVKFVAQLGNKTYKSILLMEKEDIKLI